MVTNRTRIKRRQKPQITEQMVDLFIRHEQLASIYMDCLRDDICGSPDSGVHCRECREFIEISNELTRLTGCKPWEVGALGADAAKPPVWMRDNPLQVESWARSWQLRRALKAAAKQRST